MQYTQLSRRSAGGKIDWEKQYLTFIPVEDTVFSWAERAVSGHLEYSINGGQTWVTIADGESTPTITANSKVMWRGNLKPTYSTASIATTAGIGTFSATGNYKAYGNTMSLLFYDNYYGSQFDSNDYRIAFAALFYKDTHILTAPALPATTLTERCYYIMFYSCRSLTTVPALPATTLAPICYSLMFSGCVSLVTPPELPATTLESSCYQEMFSGCTSLTTAPSILPATILANYCYSYMFMYCTALTTAPELPATTLTSGCYGSMFKGCTSLVTPPALPATTLVPSCYSQMFYGCIKLNYIKCLATDISASNCTSNWLNNVAATGTFVKDATMEDWTTGASGIPSGWAVVDDTSFVDMGLPSGTLWATRNMDVTQPDGFAASPFQYECSYFSWGNVDGHNPISASAFDYDFGAENAAAPWYEGQPYGETQGCTLQTNIPVGDTYDAARANCGSLWRIPTRRDAKELLDNVTYINADGTEVDTSKANKQVTVNGIVGVYMKSKINGNRLFLASTGRAKNSSLLFQGREGKYWCSLYRDEKDSFAWGFEVSLVTSATASARSRGFAIRPVIYK